MGMKVYFYTGEIREYPEAHRWVTSDTGTWVKLKNDDGKTLTTLNVEFVVEMEWVK